MWDRAELKNSARERMKSYQGKAIIVCLIIVVLSSLEYLNTDGTIFSFLDGNIFEISPYLKENAMLNYIEHLIHPIFTLNFIENILAEKSILIIALILLLIKVLYNCFILFPLEVGMSNFFYKNRFREMDVAEIAYAFDKKHYFHIVKTMLIMNLQLAFFTVLFIIPGIVYSYVYFLVPYILIEHPTMSTKEVLELSKKMTDGHKDKMFVLGLSFMGWAILGTVTMGLSDILFTTPYRQATNAELYHELKRIYNSKLIERAQTVSEM